MQPGLNQTGVIAGLDPPIHLFAKKMDPRVKPAGDGRKMRPCLATLAAVLVAVAGVAARPAAPAQAQSSDAPRSHRLGVVASFSILRDLAAHVGGDRVDVTALVGPGGDAHVYAPTPADARRVGAAGLVVVNGLGFEGWMDRLVQASASRAPVVVATAKITPRHAGRPGDGEDGYPEALDPRLDARGLDPHAWQSVTNAEIYVANIRDGLIAADPPGRAVYEANAAAYLDDLARLDAGIRSTVAAIPPGRRKVITTHDAFGYFAADYGVAFIAAQGVSRESEPSAKDMARIIRAIRTQNIKALFFENAVDPRLVRRIAAETGIRIGGTLYADSLSDAAGPAATYVDMMRYNVREIVEGLR
jgi:zinc/manganese transport system substrate-binding protein